MPILRNVDDDTGTAAGAGRRYITPEGLRSLREELERLWAVERPRVTREVADAAAMGDRSENAEYIYGKRRLREIDRRIRFLSKRLDELTVVEPRGGPTEQAWFGAFVTVEDEEGAERTWRLVGPDETQATSGRISIESPLGRALLGRREGDECTVVRPRGPATLVIRRITWEPPPEAVD